MRTKQAAPTKIKPTKTPYRAYSPSSMTIAYRAVMEENVSVRRASVLYGVPQTSLRQRVLGRVDLETTSSGPPPVFSDEEEVLFVEHLTSMSQLGYWYTASELVTMATDYAVFLQKRDPTKPLSTKWHRCFMKRWPELKFNKPKSVSKYTAKTVSGESVADYFERLEGVLNKLDLKDKPHCIYNVEEKSIETDQSPHIIITTKSAPAVTSSGSAMTTILGCGNAMGTMLPPFYIFKGKRVRKEHLDGSLSGSSATVTDSGVSNSAVFREFLETHFLKYLQRGETSQTVLLIFDGHKSYISVPAINWAKEHNIELFVLPSQTSHVLQPLDLGCLGCQKSMGISPSTDITRNNVARLTSRAYELALSGTNLRSAFKRTGIYPFDPSAITLDMFDPSAVYAASTSSETHKLQERNSSSFFKDQVIIIEQGTNDGEEDPQ